MTTIEVHHIDRHCRAQTRRTFPVKWFSPDGPCVSDILASRTVAGEEALALRELLRRAFHGSVDETLCGHYPDYGLRVFENDTMQFETTLCLSCANWIRLLHGQPERFRIAPEVFPEFSAALQRLVPLSSSG
jgi:hypothetical protein